LCSVGIFLVVVKDVSLGVTGDIAKDDAGLGVEGRGNVAEENVGVDDEV
jgi:hypothetical protein